MSINYNFSRLFLLLFISFTSLIYSQSTQVSVFNFPGLNGSGCGGENDNLIGIIDALPDYDVDGSITSFSNSSLLATQLDESTFFFMTDMETQDPNSTSFFPVASRAVFENWVDNGGVMVMTGTFGSRDTDFLNLIFSWDLSTVNGSSWTKNTANTAGTPFDDVATTSLPNLSATDAIKKNSVPNFTTMWGTDDNAVVAVIQYGAGYVIFMGWDFFNSGPGCGQYSHPWVQDVVPAALDYATELSDGSIDNITYTSAELTYSFSQSGQSYYVVVEDGSTPPTDAQIQSGADYAGVTIVDADNASTTANSDQLFNLSGLDYNTAYTVYVVTEYDNEGVTTFSQISDFNFTTLANDTPVVSSIGDLSFCVGDSFSPIDFTVSDEFPETPLTVVATSSNTALIQDTDLTISNTGSDYQLTYVSVDGASGSTTITVTATDSEGESATESFDITLNDVEINLPQSDYMLVVNEAITPIQPTEVSDGNTVFSITPALPAGLSLNTATGEITGTPTVAQGSIDYTLTVTTDTGCTDTLNFMLGTNSDPVIDPVADITENCPNTDAVVNVTISDNETAADDLVLTASSSNTALLNVFDISATGATRTITMTPELDQTGTATVTLTVEDELGTTVQTSFDVEFIDNEAPIASATDFVLDSYNWNNGLYAFLPGYVNDGSSDNCGIDVIDLARDEDSDGIPDSGYDDRINLSCADVGNTFDYLFRVTDVNGNQTVITRSITVEDNIAPTVITQDITVELDINGTASILPNQIDNGSNDDCSIDALALDVTSFDCSNIGDNEVTLTVTDVNGNSASQTATVTVEDNTLPEALTQDITVELGVEGTVTITADQVDNDSLDNCGVESLSLDTSTFDCSNIGANIVTLTVTDANGNSASQTATVTVEDNTLPEVLTQDITVELDVNGEATITVDDIENGSSDNCGVESLSLDITSFDCSNVGANAVTLTVTDVNGNTATEEATVTVEDNILPVALTQDITVELDVNGEATITADQVDNGSTDNCGVESLSLDITSFDCSNVGENTVTLTVTDANGNNVEATATVTVVDNVLPVALTQDITVELDVNGEATIAADQVDNGSTDNCGVESLSLDITSFDCSNVGANAVTLTVTDVNGNTATEEATVTVEDNILPVALTQDITVELDVNGEATITADQVDNGSTDNCGVESLSLDITSFDCSNVGENTVTLTVTDANGNNVEATATVTVVDNVLPEALTQDITVELDVNGEATITADQVDNGSTDNCGVESLSL
ncbi:beta strand repeat-containing protein, partial [Psychroflexus salis]|uniref:beta strand repeat-containing protein n=1 Tax=Psychroflexus salis TaxID=1526574 RepID=UPI0016657079